MNCRNLLKQTLANLLALPWMIVTILVLVPPISAYATEITDTEASESDLSLLQVDELVFLGVITTEDNIVEQLGGFKVVIDLRYPYEGVYDHLGDLRNGGIRHVSIPTSSRAPDHKNVIALESKMAEYADQQILIRDSNGHRSAMLWAAHIIHSGGDIEDALRQVEPLYESAQLRPKLNGYKSDLAALTDDGPR